MSFEAARRIADAVLYEGYLLYPYRASAVKNRMRWQFGIVAPRGYAEAGGEEPWEMQTECLIEPGGGAAVDIRVRFLQLETRGGDWDEGVECAVDLPRLVLDDLLTAPREFPIEAPAGDGRQPVSAVALVSAEPLDGFIRLRVRIENRAGWDGDLQRDRALRCSLVGAHTLLAVAGGAFVSLMDPPPEAAAAVKVCRNLHTWPVLAGAEGERGLMLSSPIILYDYPAIAPESQGDFYDGTEIDELLTLRVMTLTDEEKREACATDERARRIVERSDSIPQEIFARLHGAVRSMGAADRWEAFLNPPGVAPPEEATVEVGGRQIGKGALVRLRPVRGADAMDLFLAGRTARVEGVYRDVEERTYLAVNLEDDPGGELRSALGRFFYFNPEEVEPLEDRRE